VTPRPDASAASRRLWRYAGLLALIALVAVGTWFALNKRGMIGPHRTAELRHEGPAFVGSERCAPCHADQARAWRGSHHAAAMQFPTEQSVLGDFKDTSYNYAGLTSTFIRREGRYSLRTDGADGKLADFDVKYTFGIAPLQQYLIELPRGHVQALSIAWDARARSEGGQRWFHLYPDEKVDVRDELHWTRRAQNWNFMCADCHSTDIVKGYDVASDAYNTTYSEISVGCEACHGPGSAHLEWADHKTADPSRGLTVVLDERHGVTWTSDPATGQPRRSVARASDREIALCAQCHSRRSQIAEGYRAGLPFMDHYLPELLSPGLYYPDGQQRAEVYVWGSWLQSRMNAAGVTCSDCHEPHTEKLRATGNGVCTQCHSVARYDGLSHHHHAANSAGAQCIDCHMPATTYMVVDPRRDHSMRVPRPDETVALGVPNACDRCHRDRGAAWAASAVRKWLGRDAVGYQSFARAFHGAEQGNPNIEPELAQLAADAGQPPIVRASAAARLAELGPFDPNLAGELARDPDPLVRLASVALAEALPADARAGQVVRLLDDPRRAVRIQTARVLAAAQGAVPESLEAAWRAVSDEFLATLRYTADRPESRVALGNFLSASGKTDEAQAAYSKALALDPEFVPGYVNSADLWRSTGRDDQAAAVLEQGIARIPRSAALYYALGLTRVRQHQESGALESLKRAAELDPNTARYTYVYAVAVHSAGRVGEGIAILEQAQKRWPYDRDVLLGLASFQLAAGKTGAARQAASALIAIYPSDPDARALAGQLGISPNGQ
jgi:predicted CXXCH cytochrome family protein